MKQFLKDEWFVKAHPKLCEAIRSLKCAQYEGSKALKVITVLMEEEMTDGDNDAFFFEAFAGLFKDMMKKLDDDL